MNHFTRESWKYCRRHCWYSLSWRSFQSKWKGGHKLWRTPSSVLHYCHTHVHCQTLEKATACNISCQSKKQRLILKLGSPRSLLSTRPPSYGLPTKSYTGDLFTHITYAGDKEVTNLECSALLMHRWLWPEAVWCTGLWKCKENILRVKHFGQVILVFPNN